MSTLSLSVCFDKLLQVLTEEDMDDLDPQQIDLQASGSLFSEADQSGGDVATS